MRAQRSRSTAPIFINPLHAELNPICHLLALVGAHHIVHVGRVRVNPDQYMGVGVQLYFPVALSPVPIV